MLDALDRFVTVAAGPFFGLAFGVAVGFIARVVAVALDAPPWLTSPTLGF